jgi:hypothetical protein
VATTGFAPRTEKERRQTVDTASIALDDAVIVLDRANPGRLNFAIRASPERRLV